jgi:hypothetical protein
MSGGIGVHLVACRRRHFWCGLKYRCAGCHGFVVRRARVLDMEIEMNLLLGDAGHQAA